MFPRAFASFGRTNSVSSEREALTGLPSASVAAILAVPDFLFVRDLAI
jgi:hypothetical protein